MPANATSKILRRARRILTPPEAWCQNANARDAAGNCCDPGDAAAARWCIDGALARAGGNANLDTLATTNHWKAVAVQLKPRTAGFGSLTIWNDRPRRTQRQVLALLDRAIAAALKKHHD